MDFGPMEAFPILAPGLADSSSAPVAIHATNARHDPAKVLDLAPLHIVAPSDVVSAAALRLATGVALTLG